MKVLLSDGRQERYDLVVYEPGARRSARVMPCRTRSSRLKPRESISNIGVSVLHSRIQHGSHATHWALEPRWARFDSRPSAFDVA